MHEKVINKVINLPAQPKIRVDFITPTGGVITVLMRHRNLFRDAAYAVLDTVGIPYEYARMVHNGKHLEWHSEIFTAEMLGIHDKSTVNIVLRLTGC